MHISPNVRENVLLYIRVTWIPVYQGTNLRRETHLSKFLAGIVYLYEIDDEVDNSIDKILRTIKMGR